MKGPVRVLMEPFCCRTTSLTKQRLPEAMPATCTARWERAASVDANQGCRKPCSLRDRAAILRTCLPDASFLGPANPLSTKGLGLGGSWPWARSRGRQEAWGRPMAYNCKERVEGKVGVFLLFELLSHRDAAASARTCPLGPERAR